MILIFFITNSWSEIYNKSIYLHQLKTTRVTATMMVTISHQIGDCKIEKIMINIRFINYSTKNTRWHNPINGIWFFITYSGKIGIPRYFYRFGIFVPSSELFDRVSYSWKASESFVIFESSFIGNTWLYRACCLRFARTLSKEIWISSNEILLELLLYFFY